MYNGKNWNMNLKERYRAFVEWQRRPPFNYELKSTETQHCNNCGHEFTGNYCPYCSQKAGTDRLTWVSVQKGIMDIWAMGARSMPFSIWQLLTRPGYFIADYITGKRMVSFPPVKMLFVLAVIVSIIEYWFFPTQPSESTAAISDANGLTDVVQACTNWLNENKGWGMLSRGALFILPSWVLFRHAPRLPFHTLPEGFFIQVFIGIQMLFLTFMGHFGVFFESLSLLYIVYTYSQLFGYGLWGTLWRLGVLMFVVLATIVFIVVLYITVFAPEMIQSTDHKEDEGLYVALGSYSVFLFLLLCVVLVLYFGYRIGQRGMRKRKQNEALKTVNPVAEAAADESSATEP